MKHVWYWNSQNDLIQQNPGKINVTKYHFRITRICKNTMKFVFHLIFKVFHRIDFNRTPWRDAKIANAVAELSEIACKCKTRPAGKQSYLLRWPSRLLRLIPTNKMPHRYRGQSLNQSVSLTHHYQRFVMIFYNYTIPLIFF